MLSNYLKQLLIKCPPIVVAYLGVFKNEKFNIDSVKITQDTTLQSVTLYKSTKHYTSGQKTLDARIESISATRPLVFT